MTTEKQIFGCQTMRHNKWGSKVTVDHNVKEIVQCHEHHVVGIVKRIRHAAAAA